MSAAIEITDLWVQYGNTVAVRGVDLVVPSGTIFGFLGPNGAGKTSTIRVLLDLLRPSRGAVKVLGTSVREGDGSLRGRMGFLPGDLALFPQLTGIETLDLFAGLYAREPSERAHVLSSLGFPMGALGRRVATYSTGMRQMIGLCAAMQHAPEVLILDEPTSGLDPLVRDALLELLATARGRGTTIFLSSHVLAEVEACADRVALIDRGRLILEGGVEDLRRACPRRIVLTHRDGRRERILHRGSIVPFLEQLDPSDVADIEIRPPGLDEVVRTMLKAGGE